MRRASMVLPAPGRADHQQVVAAGRGHLERASRERLPAQVGQVHLVVAGDLGGRRWRRRRAASRRDAGSAGPPRPTACAPAAAAGLRRPRPRRCCRRAAAAPPRPAAAPPRQSAARRARDGWCRRATARRRCTTSRMSRVTTTPLAARMPSAIGRSNDEPALRTSAGARLMVMRCCGKSKPELRMAAWTRSRLSLTLVSGSPTSWKRGRPKHRSTSTCTGLASIPMTEALSRLASMPPEVQRRCPRDAAGAPRFRRESGGWRGGGLTRACRSCRRRGIVGADLRRSLRRTRAADALTVVTAGRSPACGLDDAGGRRC